MLYGAVLRSPVAHAQLLSVDTSAAERIPGVVAVLAGADLTDLDPYYGHALRDRPIVAIDKIRFIGEPVAVVAAESQATADYAATRVDLVYAELPTAASLATALAPGAAEIHEGPLRPGSAHGLGKLPDRDGNVCYRYSFERGDLDGAFERRRGRRGGGVHLSRRIPVLDGDPYHHRPVPQRRDHLVVVVPASLPGPAGDGGSFRPAAGLGPGDRSVPGRRIRQQVLHQDGADRRGDRPQGRAAGPHSERGGRVNGHHPAAQHGMHNANRRRRRRHATRPGR